MLDKFLMLVGGFNLIWGMTYFYHLVVYSVGDRKHINQLVNNLTSDPNKFKQRHYLAMRGIGSGGILTMFSLVYPFIRSRRRQKKWTFDFFMWLNHLLFISFTLTYFLY